MPNLSFCLDQLSSMHHHLCPKQVLGVRTAMLASQTLGLEMPRQDKRVFAFIETDGCYADGVSVGSGCWVGHRTMRMMDYGKVATTFVDIVTGRAIRIRPAPTSRTHANAYAPNAIDRWHAQLEAYHKMPDDELLQVQDVRLTVALDAIISKHGLRVVCARCGEDIINERELRQDGLTLCRACAGNAYFAMRTEVAIAAPVALQVSALVDVIG
jgi:formylmethanofuran dehydrogenase subunit E